MKATDVAQYEAVNTSSPCTSMVYKHHLRMMQQILPTLLQTQLYKHRCKCQHLSLKALVSLYQKFLSQQAFFTSINILALSSLPFGKMILDVSFSTLIYSDHDQIFNKTISQYLIFSTIVSDTHFSLDLLSFTKQNTH